MDVHGLIWTGVAWVHWKDATQCVCIAMRATRRASVDVGALWNAMTCDAAQRGAMHCNTIQCIAVRRRGLQYNAMEWNTAQHVAMARSGVQWIGRSVDELQCSAAYWAQGQQCSAKQW
eukprot:11172182-Lingulodinium_polyedra.AAC.1